MAGYRIWIGEDADTQAQIIESDGTKRPAQAIVCLEGVFVFVVILPILQEPGFMMSAEM